MCIITVAMMNSFYIALSYSLIIWSSANAVNHPPDEVVLRLIDGMQVELPITLKKVDSFLANENLPVWTLRRDNPDELIPDYETMKLIGSYSMYQDNAQTSAAVYFHQLNLFFGTIDIRFIITGITLEDAKKPVEIMYFESVGVMARHIDTYGHRMMRSVEKKDLPLHHLETIGEELSNKSQFSIRSRRDVQDVFYVKILVIVDYTVVQELGLDRNTGIVRYLLILFNSVDMLYSKVEGLNIKINIAGIIIESNHGSFSSMDHCYKHMNRNGKVVTYIDAQCSNEALTSYLSKQSNVISPDSYNIAIFFTSDNLRFKLLFINKKLGGMTSSRVVSPYVAKQVDAPLAPVVTVEYKEYFGYFPVIAHEIAHALRYHGHHTGPHFNEHGTCSSSLMKPHSEFCENCLSWSSDTTKHFVKFFSSRNRCFFMQTPSSLLKPGPRVAWTADEQCRCYGYESAGTPAKPFLHTFSRTQNDKCQLRLRCYDKNHKSFHGPFPMDGTLCGEDADGTSQVCWKKRCVSVGKDAK